MRPDNQEIEPTVACVEQHLTVTTENGRQAAHPLI
jgi:hypothetical protein